MAAVSRKEDGHETAADLSGDYEFYAAILKNLPPRLTILSVPPRFTILSVPPRFTILSFAAAESN
jgi:hypothetical protein